MCTKQEKIDKLINQAMYYDHHGLYERAEMLLALVASLKAGTR